jgi:hypothetical protein
MTSAAAAALRGAIRVYQLTLSAWMGRQCRFGPSCSDYAMEAVERHGALRGGRLAIKRIGRCHPWGGSGYDPVPDATGPTATDPTATGPTATGRAADVPTPPHTAR